MYVRAGRPAFAQPCVGVHKSASLISSSSKGNQAQFSVPYSQELNSHFGLLAIGALSSSSIIFGAFLNNLAHL